MKVLRRPSVDVEGRRVLELGCGTGLNTEWLAERARSVVAVDFSREMLSKARARVQSDNVQFVEHDLTEPWPVEGPFDVVVGTLVLEHIERLRPLFSEAYRHLADGGQYYVCELHPYRQLQGGQAQYVDADSGEEVPVPAYLHNVSAYVNAARHAGFHLQHLGEWPDEPPVKDQIPRLITFLFDK